MDVVALAQFGINYAVATLGTATTEFHLKELFKNVNTIVFCFDGDKAGRDAARKALDIALPQVRGDRIVQFMFLPQGEDPDTMVRKIGKEAFEEQINSSQSLSEYLLTSLAEGLDLTNLDNKSSFIGRLNPYLGKMTNPLYQDMVTDEAAKKLGISVEQLKRGIDKPEQAKVATRPRSKASHAKTITPMRMLIASLVQNPELAKEVTSTEWLTQIHQAGVDLLKSLLELLHQNPHLKTGSLLEHWRDKPEFNQLQTLASWELMINDHETHQTVFRDAIGKLFIQLRQERLDYLVSKQKTGSLAGAEIEELRQLLSNSS
jgi:DNA primase